MIIPLRNRGDTIIEVLIVISIISAVLGGAYVTLSRSDKGVRQAQERGEALKMVEEQLERLKSIASSQPTVFTTNFFFCLDAADAIIEFNPPAAPSATPIPSGLPSNPDNYPTACTKSNVPGGYHLAIEHSLAPAPTDTFTIHNTWLSASGNGNDQVNVVYRVHP